MKTIFEWIRIINRKWTRCKKSRNMSVKSKSVFTFFDRNDFVNKDIFDLSLINMTISHNIHQVMFRVRLN